MKKKNKREFSPFEKSVYFDKMADREIHNINRRKELREYSREMQDFATASGYGDEFPEESQFECMFDYPTLGDSFDDYKKYVKRRWIARKAGRFGDVVARNGKIRIKNYSKYEKDWNKFLKRSGYFK